MIKGSLVSFFIIFAMTLAPKEAVAEMFSFIGKLFASEETSILPLENQNSQNMPLFQASKSSNGEKQIAVLSVVGQTAIENVYGPSGTVKQIAEKELSNKISLYTVRDGDSLSSVAKMFDVSVNTIIWANQLKSASDIYPGQNLLILPISGVKYIVKKGDTIKSIATYFKGDADEILRFNNVDDAATLSIGGEIIIPDGEISVPSKSNGSITKSNGSLIDTTGYFMRPITGGTRTQGLHGGCDCAVDLADSVGAPVYAAADGTVIVATTGGWHGGYAIYTVISHPNGTQTLYAHLSKNFFKVGDTVTKGEKIGEMGSTGNSTGSHLHFEIRGSKNPF